MSSGDFAGSGTAATAKPDAHALILVPPSVWTRPRWACGWPVDEKEAYAWLSLTWLSGLANCLRFALPFLDLVFLGHLSTDSLAAASLANVWLAMTSVWLWGGQEEALSTLVAQAMGAGNSRLAGAWMQIAAVTVVLASLPLLLAWWWTGAVLTGLGFGPETLTAQAQIFARWYAISLIPTGLFSAGSSWLVASGAASLPIFAGVSQVLAGVGANLLLIWGVGSWPGLGFIGSPLSTGIVAVCGLMALVVLVSALGIGAARGCRSATAVHWDLVCSPRLLRVYAEQLLPNAIGQALEILQLQVLAGVAAHLGAADLAAHNALVNFFMLASCFMFGAVRGSSVRVGACLGADRIDLAKQTVVVSLAGLGALGVASGLVVAIARAPLSHMFTDDPAIVSLIEPLLPLAAGALVFFSLEFTAIGTLLGQGRALPVSIAVLIGNWLVCIPLSFVATRVMGWGLMGIWVSLLVGYAVVTVLCCVLLWRSDWPRLRDEALARNRTEEETAAALAAAADAAGGARVADDDAKARLLQA